VNRAVLEAVKLKTSSWNNSQRVVALVMDEMSIKEGLSYDSGQDLVEGFVPDTKDYASQALVFMIRGLKEKWKQAVVYYLSKSAMKGEQLQKLLLDCIKKVEEAGLKVVVVIADQGSNNQNVFRRLGVTENKPFFKYESNQVVCMYDPPHLLKSVRNNLADHGYTAGTENISWEYIKKFHDFDSAMPIRSLQS
jgi:hypothetical protein